MIIVGHRSAADHVLENTLGSIEKAIELGADYVEVDVRRTRDGTLVLMHDETVDRTTTGHGVVAEMTWEDVKRLRTPDDQHVPMLEEVLALCNNRIGLLLELKATGIAEEIVTVVGESHMSTRLMYASFHHPELLRVRHVAPSAAIMPLIGRLPIDPQTVSAFGE